MSISSLDVVRLSKFLSYVLRHRPDSIGLSLDKHGWANVQELLSKAAEFGVTLTFDDIKQIVAENNKKRFVLCEQSARIRATQGHSINVDLKLAVRSPPVFLYHGTVAKFLPAIRKKGLLPMNRHDVHLSQDKETATAVAARRGDPVVLVIETPPMVKAGFQFRLSENGVWLLPTVPARYIKFPE